ncbi:MAG: hypothetical protein ACYCWW_20595 [Deltaproteobacteria bacterium]
MGNNNGTGGAGINPTAQQKSAPKGLFLAFTLLKSGVDDLIPPKSSITIGGQSVTQSSLSAELGNDIALFQAVIDLHAKLQSAVGARKAAEPGLKSRYAQIVKAIEGQFAPRGSGAPEVWNPPPQAPPPP